MQTSDALDKIAPALVKAQSELKHAIKDATNPHFKSKYADLGAVWDAAKPVLTANKLAALQDVVSSEAGLGVRTRILHESGQWIEFDPPIIALDKRNAQGAGSALTYGRRYSLSAALGVVADEDDDGNAASNGTGNGVADAQRSQPVQIDRKASAPGITKARQWVAAELHDLHGCTDGDALMAHVREHKGHWVRIYQTFPDLWEGPDGSGLRGEAMKLATMYECRPAFDAWLEEITNAVTVKEAAE